MRFAEVVETSRTVAAASGRLRKIELLASLLARTPPPEIESTIHFLIGSLRQGRIGIGAAAIASARSVNPSDAASLDVADVDRAFDQLSAIRGAGSASARAEALRALMRRATGPEQDFLARLLFGELRQGALEGVLAEAVAKAVQVPADTIRRAAMLAGSLVPVARDVLTTGPDALAGYAVQLFHPIQPMLAESAADAESALAELGEASLEYKLDGARIQVHKAGDEVRVFTRNLREVTAAVPEVVEAVGGLAPRELILDGEAIALRADGTPHPFQITMRRFGRRLQVDALRGELPITPVFFDCLYADGAPIIDEPFVRRSAALVDAAPQLVVPRIVTADAGEAAAFVERAIAAGHEGAMAKALGGAYTAGRRGEAWLKVKRARTLDLVVLAVEWGSGRRHGMLSNLHLGARDAVHGGFVMLGKTFKGLTDEMLAWQTRTFLDLEVARDRHIVYVRPEVVVEIAFNDVQESPQYPGRLALRFARVKRYRTDKRAAEADTFEAVQQIYRATTGLEPPPR